MHISTENIKVKIGDTDILKGININANNKEFIGIIGPNGSGKSTLLKCIYRSLKPNSGIIKLDDIDLSKISVRESSKKLAVLSQHNNYNFDFSVKDILLMGRSPHKKFLDRDTKEDYDIIYDALDKVGMVNFINRTFLTLSGGEQQRIILARALAQQTECLILDEPTNHLDIKYQIQLMSIVKNLNIEVVAAIHDLNIAAMYCDKLYVLKEGIIVAYGTPKEILTSKLIKDVYGVDSVIIENPATNLLNICYNPM